MAKVNPVMQHVKPVLTPEQIAIEDFINSIPPTIVMEGDTIVADNTISEWIAQDDVPSLDPIVETVEVADTLDDLAEDVDRVTAAPAMESYRRIFSQLVNLTGHPLAEQTTVAVESFQPTVSGKVKLAKAIRGHAEALRTAALVALEDYAEKIDESLGTMISNYKQAMGELNHLRVDPDVIDSNVNIDHKQVWKLFHIKGKLADLKDFDKEIEGVKKLADEARKGIDRVKKSAVGEVLEGPALEGSLKVNLLANSDISIKNGRSYFDEKAVPAPDKSWTLGDWFWIFIFNWAGLAYRIIKGGSGDEKTKKKQSLKAIHDVINKLKELAPVIDGIAKEAHDLIKFIDQQPEDKQAELKKAASPVLELVAKTVQHVTKVTYGAKKIFEKAEA